MRRAGRLAAIAIGLLGVCLVVGALVEGDSMLGIEIGSAVLAATWIVLVARELHGMRRLEVLLSPDAREVPLHGVPCRVTPTLGADAVVLGSLRPRIYVGLDTVSELSEEELRAVIHHEDHHRRTRAPLRAAALLAWLRILGRSGLFRRHLLDRLADLETLADADAIRRGSEPRSLARALLKSDAGLRPVAFAYAAERRVLRLLEQADGTPVQTGERLPYEWLPAIATSVALLGCHVGL